ncbi:MAG: FAD-dependent oxidoreductase [Deltaproteobacteria bacterium]|nr:FAD-dependent oxidoreductase [Deltaproteobacteria bacterium]
MKRFSHLFSPISLGNLTIRNRIVMPPMHTGFAGTDGSVTERISDYYEARARGGAGLIIVEAATPNGKRKYVPRALGLFDDSLIPGWRTLAGKIHAQGAKLATQLFDPGPAAPSFLSGLQPVGPSPVADRSLRELPRELGIDEIEDVVADFISAARRAREAGLDAIEIHAAHNYALVGSFLSSYYNKRTDAYGGSLESRAKLLLDIVRGIRSEFGDDFPIIVRISGDDRSPGGRSLGETQILAPLIAEAGAQALEISGGIVPELFWAVVPPAGTPLAFNADFAEAIRKVAGIPVICVGRINTPGIAEFVLQSGKADMVSMGRALMADPEMPLKAQAGNMEDIAPCIACNQGCLVNPFGEKASSCCMNPSMGREKDAELLPAEKPRRILVVGGGPAGLEAARTAASRGHRVVLFEKDRKLGGQIGLAGVPPFKQEIVQSIKYLSRQAEKAGVEVRLGEKAGTETAEALQADVVIVAAGAVPKVAADIPGITNERVVTAWDVLAGKGALNAREVVIIGGGDIGCEVADFLAEPGDNLTVPRISVTILEMMRRVAREMPLQSRHLLMERLRRKGVRIITSAKVREIGDEGVIFVRNGIEETTGKADCIVLAMGSESVDGLSQAFRDAGKEVHVIGDALKPRSLLEAIAEGREIGCKL